MIKSIAIGDRIYRLSGTDGDPYFGRLEDFSAANADLYNWMSKSLAEDATCLDVGANLGLMAIAMAHYCPRGTIYAFEPSPISLANLRENISRNNITNIHVVDMAVGSVSGIVHFWLPQNTGGCVIMREAPTGGNHAPVRMESLDTWWSEQGKPHVDFIKIDVEGHETEVLRGAANLLTSCTPQSFVEFNSITMVMESRISPLSFAEAVWKHFDICTISGAGTEVAVTNAREFTYHNMTQHGFLQDILIHPKIGLTPQALIDDLPHTARAAMVE